MTEGGKVIAFAYDLPGNAGHFIPFYQHKSQKYYIFKNLGLRLLSNNVIITILFSSGIS